MMRSLTTFLLVFILLNISVPLQLSQLRNNGFFTPASAFLISTATASTTMTASAAAASDAVECTDYECAADENLDPSFLGDQTWSVVISSLLMFVLAYLWPRVQVACVNAPDFYFATAGFAVFMISEIVQAVQMKEMTEEALEAQWSSKETLSTQLDSFKNLLKAYEMGLTRIKERQVAYNWSWGLMAGAIGFSGLMIVVRGSLQGQVLAAAPNINEALLGSYSARLIERNTRQAKVAADATDPYKGTQAELIAELKNIAAEQAVSAAAGLPDNEAVMGVKRSAQFNVALGQLTAVLGQVASLHPTLVSTQAMPFVSAAAGLNAAAVTAASAFATAYAACGSTVVGCIGLPPLAIAHIAAMNAARANMVALWGVTDTLVGLYANCTGPILGLTHNGIDRPSGDPVQELLAPSNYFYATSEDGFFDALAAQKPQQLTCSTPQEKENLTAKLRRFMTAEQLANFNQNMDRLGYEKNGLFEKMMKKLMPKPAYATGTVEDPEEQDMSWEGWAILGAGAGGLVFSLINNWSAIVIKALSGLGILYWRWVIYGFFGGLFALNQYVFLENAKTELEERKALVDEMVAELQAKYDEGIADETTPDIETSTNPNLNTGRSRVDNTPNTTPAVPKCQTDDCPVLEAVGMTGQDFSIAGSGAGMFSSIASNTQNGITNKSNGNGAAGDAYLEKNGQYASRLKQLNKKLEKKINKLNKKNKLKSKGLGKLKNAIAAKIGRASQKYLSGLSPNELGALKSFGNISSDLDKVTKKASKLAPKLAALVPKKAAAPKFDFKFDDSLFKEELKEEVPAQAVAAKDSDEFDYNQGDDISKRKGVSIFKMISSRYNKSAYPVFFEEIK